MSKHFLVMAGGTGGHVYPALGFAELARQSGHKISWLGTEQGLEARVVPANRIELHCIEISGVRGKGIKSLVSAPIKIMKAIQQARKILKNPRPDLVIGFGGYSAGPGGVAARMAGIPLVIHEQNAVAGTTNKLLSRIASKVLCGFEQALPNALTVGNPVREEIVNLPGKHEAVNDPQWRPRLLVLGGSLGARFLNESVPVALQNMLPDQRPIVRHQAGPKLLDEARASYAKAGVEAEITAFIEDMAEAYQWADMVVCRAGAMTVSEIAVVGLPALFVPFPYAIDDHQTANANWLVSVNAALLYQQSEQDLNRFGLLLTGLLKDQERLAQMSEKARLKGIRNSAQQILKQCEELTNVA
jgi:UDP-N-acetylglucosamine--N-acetylmuramyl-(pentapeptide) pyrophosphoryl-undecaprenol N-acetylglucosamine transferase